MPGHRGVVSVLGLLVGLIVSSALATGAVAQIAVSIGHWSQGVAFSGDGKTLLVQNMVEKEIWVFAVDGTTLRDTGHRIKVNGGPAAIRTADKLR